MNKNPNFITIMWFRTFGQMKSLKVSLTNIKRLLALSIFLVLLLLFSLLFNIYFGLSNFSLKREIVDLKKGIKNTKELCEENNNEMFQPTLKLSKNREALPAKKPSGIIKEKVQIDTITDSLINISNVSKTVDYNKKIVSLKFHLKNLKSTANKAISGYVILMGRNEDIAESIYTTYPSKVKLNNGFPSDYRQGESFYIKNLKIVEGKLTLSRKNSEIKEIVIYVFSRIGELLLEKTVPVGEE